MKKLFIIIVFTLLLTFLLAGISTSYAATTYKNYVFDQAGGDVQCLRDPSGWYYVYYPKGYYCYALKSKDLVSWTYVGAVYNNKDDGYGGEEATGLWAPEVHIYNGKYYLYYASVMTGGAQPDTVGNKDVVVVEGSSPTSFNKATRTVLLDNDYAYIDPHLFKDTNGQLYLYNKYRGPYGTGSELQGRAMSDPKTISGSGVTLIRSTDVPSSIGSGQIEHPSLFSKNGNYDLFFSIGDGASADPATAYKVCYAKATSPLGPYTLAANNPLMYTGQNPGVYTPGATSIVLDGNNVEWMVYRQKKDGGEVRDLVLCIERCYITDTGDVNITATRNQVLTAPVPLP